jgi:hypothetical protein
MQTALHTRNTRWRKPSGREDSWINHLQNHPTLGQRMRLLPRRGRMSISLYVRLPSGPKSFVFISTEYRYMSLKSLGHKPRKFCWRTVAIWKKLSFHWLPQNKQLASETCFQANLIWKFSYTLVPNFYLGFDWPFGHTRRPGSSIGIYV